MRSLSIPSYCCGKSVMPRTFCLVACVAGLLLSGCGGHEYDGDGALHVADAVTLEGIAEAYVEFATTKGLGNRSPDQFLDAVSTQSGTTGPNGCVEVIVPSAFDPSSFGSPIWDSVFDRLWIVRVSKGGYSEAIIIETAGSARPGPEVPRYEGEGERFVVTGLLTFGMSHGSAAEACAEEME